MDFSGWLARYTVASSDSVSSGFASNRTLKSGSGWFSSRSSGATSIGNCICTSSAEKDVYEPGVNAPDCSRVRRALSDFVDQISIDQFIALAGKESGLEHLIHFASGEALAARRALGRQWQDRG